jgi:hypothetical protein
MRRHRNQQKQIIESNISLTSLDFILSIYMRWLSIYRMVFQKSKKRYSMDEIMNLQTKRIRKGKK